LRANFRLEREIDKVRTRIGAVVDVLTGVIDLPEGIRDAVRKVASLLQEAKAGEKERPLLSAPSEPKRIEAPKAPKPPKPKKNGFGRRELDDEIPF